MSRPKKEVTQSELIRFKVTKEEKERIKMEAQFHGMSVSEYIRDMMSHNSMHLTNETLSAWQKYRKEHCKK